MKYLTCSDLQRRYSIGRSTVYRWVDDPRVNLPKPLKIGFRILWRESDLDAFDASLSAPTRPTSMPLIGNESGGI